MSTTTEPAHAEVSEALPSRGVSPLESLTDRDALERLLARSLRTGAGDAAQSLLRRFGSLAGVLGAEAGALAPLVPSRAQQDLWLIRETARRLVCASVPRRAIISSWSALMAYLKVTMAHCEREAFRVLFLDKKNQLVLDEVMNVGTVDHAPVYPREVMRRALELSASALILAHYVARHIMGVMCPAPLCGRSRAFSSLRPNLRRAAGT